MDTRLWVIAFDSDNPDVIPDAGTTPDFSGLTEVVAADMHFVIVNDTYAHCEQLVDGYPYWRIASQPKAGRWTDAGGDVIYIDDSAQVVADATAVLGSLSRSPEDGADPDDVLDQLGRTF